MIIRKEWRKKEREKGRKGQREREKEGIKREGRKERVDYRTAWRNTGVEIKAIL